VYGHTRCIYIQFWPTLNIYKAVAEGWEGNLLDKAIKLLCVDKAMVNS